ncbi:MAG TPA: META domain-containing protein [Acidimicrobiales bacterium]|nr:META domain-containing protein [Acidimicrobiales bacterium]
MTALTEVLSKAAGPEQVGFTSEDIRRCVTRRQRRRRRARLAGAGVLVAVVGLTAAFGPLSDGDSPEEVETVADEPEQIIGRWELTSITGIAAIEEPASIEFRDDGRLKGDTGCNQFGYRWSIVDGRLVTHGGGGTLMLCTNPSGTVERLLQEMLSGDPAIAPSDDEEIPRSGTEPWTTLRLTAPDGSFALFERSLP